MVVTAVAAVAKGDLRAVDPHRGSPVLSAFEAQSLTSVFVFEHRHSAFVFEHERNMFAPRSRAGFCLFLSCGVV